MYRQMWKSVVFFINIIKSHEALTPRRAHFFSSCVTVVSGSLYFPGGLGAHTEVAGSLEFEAEPSADISLRWATYYDAADQAGIFRLYGGIHVAIDDGPGRIMGSKIGKTAVGKVLAYSQGEILQDFQCTFTKDGDGTMSIS